MKDTGNMKNLIIGLVMIIILGFAVFFYISREPYVDEALLTGVPTGVAAGSVDGNFIAALNSLRRLKLDDSIFANPAWGTLVDFGRTLAPQPYGRSNPFAPVGGETASAQ